MGLPRKLAVNIEFVDIEGTQIASNNLFILQDFFLI